jgi:23S rRNA (uridine2552-2'-O)-methyltransferase
MARTRTSKAWMREHVEDPWVQKARAEGWRSRAAFKLMQIDARDRLLRPGARVVDLGSTPGGWSQVAVKAVGRQGRVVAVDLLEMVPIAGVHFLQGDFERDETVEAVRALLDGRAANLVLSDMAPNLSGIGAADQARMAGLAEAAAQFALEVLTPDGAFLTKVFHGVGFDALLRDLRGAFRTVAVRKPEASRGRSPETYLLARGPRRADPEIENLRA